ncbi:MAG TPA: hypothetical protein VHZ50_16335 [Puia sp.]|jgi:hypothetical protein|nr:hypothetical protein [Puia sp.]
MPSYAQAKKVIWDSVTNEGMRILDYFPQELISQKNSQEMKIRLKNGSLFQLIGSDNIDSLMGTNPKIVVFSEYALQDPIAWDYIRPILRVNNGYAIFISTPRGRNHFHEIFRTAQTTIGWFHERLSIDDTNILSTEDISKERLDGMSEELIQQEFYCSFDRGIEGSYYANLIRNMMDNERIVPFDYDSYRPVHCAFDLGWDDSTAIIFFQIFGNEIRVIDCEEHSTQTLKWYKDLLDKKGYKYGAYLFPFDVETTDGLISGCTRKEFLEGLGISVTVVPKLLISDGIEAVKALMSNRLYINSKKCQPLIKSLEHYHREWDDKHKVYKNAPRHNWASHYSDALRYLAIGLHKIHDGSSSVDNDLKALRAYWG